MNRLLIIGAIYGGSMLLTACGSDQPTDAGQAAAAESQPAPAAPAPPPAEPKTYGPAAEATLYSAKHDMGFDYDTTLWMPVPADKLEGLFDLIGRGKPTPTFQVLGGLMLRANAGQELQHPVVSFGLDVLQGPAPTLEDARRQSGAASYPLNNLQKDLPAHFREERFPRPLVDQKRNALYMKTLGSFKPSEETQIMQAIFISPDKLPFLHLAFPNDDPKDYHRQFAAMVESFRRGS
jgi:hypothetical protein